MTTYFSFAIADSMFPPECGICRTPLTVELVRAMLVGAFTAINPSHKPTIDAAVKRYGLAVEVPEKAPAVKLGRGDSLIVMSVRGLPRLEGRHEYTDAEIAAATFEFGLWHVWFVLGPTT